MAGYGKDIVSTRKLNDNKKAKLGRNGDTEIGKVDGEKSHITAWEGSLIDSFGEAGEEYVKDVGAGTKNPYTGLKEYSHKPGHWNIWSNFDLSFEGIDPGAGFKDMTTEDWENFSMEGSSVFEEWGAGDTYTPYEDRQMPTGNLSYDQLTDIFEQDDLNKYLQKAFGADVGEDYRMYFEDPSRGEGEADDAFDFLERQKLLTETNLETARTQALTASRLEQEGLGRTATTQGYDIAQSTQAAQGKAGFAGQGAAVNQMNRQMKNIARDYSAGMEGIRAGRETIQSDYTQGIEESVLDYRKGVFDEERRIIDRFYDMIGTLTQAEAWETGSGTTSVVPPGSGQVPGAGGHGGCVIATHALSNGQMAESDRLNAVEWCTKNLHGKWWGEIMRKGYRYLGRKHIANNSAKNIYKEFKECLEWANGKRPFKLNIAIRFYLRVLQTFIVGLFIKED